MILPLIFTILGYVIWYLLKYQQGQIQNSPERNIKGEPNGNLDLKCVLEHKGVNRADLATLLSGNSIIKAFCYNCLVENQFYLVNVAPKMTVDYF